jgi:filamentous hemagglutinin family protein
VDTTRSVVFPTLRRAPKRTNAALVLLLSIGLAAPAQAQSPVGGRVVSGDAEISGEGTSTTRIVQLTGRAVIDWRSFGIGADNAVVFVQPSSQSATLNRVTGDQVSIILGRLDANGHVLLINPNGIVFGAGAQVNVGSLIATTSDISNANFMAGRLTFDQPGRLGAGVVNAGAITARDGGLVALVAPHVRNDGVIVAHLGKVALGAADTFTVDLYGDALINLALSDAHAGQLHQANGDAVTSLVTNTGRIEVAGGEAVLMTARTAKNVPDWCLPRARISVSTRP